MLRGSSGSPLTSIGQEPRHYTSDKPCPLSRAARSTIRLDLVTKTALCNLLFDELRKEGVHARGRMEVIGKHIRLVRVGGRVGRTRAKQGSVVGRSRRVTCLTRIRYRKTIGLEVGKNLVDPAKGVDLDHFALQPVGLQCAIQRVVE